MFSTPAGVREALRHLSLPQLPIVPLNSQGPMTLSPLIKRALEIKATSTALAAAAATRQQQQQAVQGGLSLQSNWPRQELGPLTTPPSAGEVINLEAEEVAGAKPSAAEALAGEQGYLVCN